MHYIVVFKPWLSYFEPLIHDRPLIGVDDLTELEQYHGLHVVEAHSFYLVGPPSFADPYQALYLRQLSDVAVGLLPAEDVEKAIKRWKRNQTVAKRSEDVMISRIDHGGQMKAQGLSIYLEGSLQNAEQTRGILSTPLRVLAVTGHGRGDVVYLPHLVLCGKKTDADGGVYSDYRLPSCFYDGDCFYRGCPQFSVDQLDVQILFLNNCATVSGEEGLFHHDFTLDRRILENEQIHFFIGSPTIRHGEHGQSLLLSSLTNGGYTLGEIVTLIDDVMVLKGIDMPSLLLYGDPGIRLQERSPEAIQVTTAEGWFHLEKPASAILISSAADSETIYQVKGPIDVHVLPTRQGYFVVGNGPLPIGGYQIKRVALNEIIADAREQLLNAVNRIKHVKILNIHPDKLAGQLKDLEQYTARLRTELRHAIEYSSVESFNRTLQLGKRVITKIDELILKNLIDRSARSTFHLIDNYRHECTYSLAPQQEHVCDYCGRSIRTLLWKHRLLEDFGRISLHCTGCGYLSDHPADSLLRAKLVSETDNPMLGTRICVRMELEDKAPLNSLLAVMILDTSRYGVPKVADSCVVEQEATTFHFHLTIPKELPPHHFPVKAVLVHQGKIHTWGSNLWIRK